MVRALDEGEGDFIAAGKTITPSRQKLVDFSDEYLSVQQRVVAHEDNHSINDAADLNGKTLHVRRATSYAERLSELQKQGLEFINMGPGHITSAQSVARKKGLDPYKWSSLEKTLPLLCYEKYIKASKYGYCRGTEPVRYVNRILTYFDILRRKAA